MLALSMWVSALLKYLQQVLNVGELLFAGFELS
ncbi:hypothetical protein HAL011_05970 [Helicobacter ailurogastricus]|uniref:Uncharacterized protein n=1 Tax=Helicobacter ailurogastricus TaxID=1578720 RepID=A0A0K2X5M0_9HELI|nr:hypothetical protein HAL011_05970 [Helicobacter ailurogastricus]